MTREKMWEEFETGILDVVERWKKRLEQEPKTGRWIDINSKSYELHRVYKCSECGTTEIEYPESIYRRCRYCPNCGAKMIEPQESEEE